MKFGELLAASLISGWEAHYFDYWKLKEYIKRGTMELEGRKPEFNHQEFVQLFQQEDRRVVLFVNGKLAELVNELAFQTNRYTVYNRAACQEIGAMVIKFDRYMNDAWNAQQKILKKYRKWTGQSTSGWFNPKECALAKAQNIVHSLIVAFSTLSERQWATADSDWVPPDSFVRKTVKYWVRPEHATATKLFLIQQLPILEVNKTPFPPPSLEGEKHSQIHNYLSSVYMDNDAADCYHRRIALEEGANLLRVRWYGGETGPDGFPRPNSGSTFFMELKTHHNPDVSGLKSTKERFPITARMIPGFLSGKLAADQVIDAMVAQGHIKPAKETEQKELATFIQNLVTTMKLKPWIRTVYHRTAFQRSDSNEVRVSFDLPLILHPEHPTWDGKNWMDLFKVNNMDAKPFGYGVLEVKTSDEPPAWVEELLATGWLIRVEKFSKFQHATAAFHPEAIRVLPYWINSDITKEIAKQQPEQCHALVQKAASTKDVYVSQPMSLRQSRPESPNTVTDDLYAPLLMSINGDESPKSTRSSMRLDSIMKSPNKGGPQSLGKASVDRQTPTFVVPSGPPPPPRGSNLTRMRVEPKVFFANERTFLKWMFAVVILISVSMTVMSMNSRAVPYGISLLATACVLIIYAVGLYRWRLTKILKREGTRFDDRIGPFLIAACLFAAVCVVFAFAWTNGEESIFVCQRTVPSCSVIDVDPDVTTVTVYSTDSFTLAEAVARVEACVEVEAEGPTTDGSSSSGTSHSQKKTKTPKPVIVWDTNNTFLIPQTNALNPEMAYLKYEDDVEELSFSIRNDSMYFPILLAHGNQSSGVVSFTVRSVCQGQATYVLLTKIGVASLPVTAMDVNAIFNISFFAPTETFQTQWELRSRYTYSNVVFANGKAKVTILPQFLNEDDRSLQTNAVDVRIAAEVTKIAGEPFRYSTLRQVQSFIQALTKPDERREVLRAQWKR